MINQLAHRGPDDEGFFLSTVDDGATVGMAHKRLSIQDTSFRGHQPFKFSDLITVYNGEIYNFKEIERDLVELGYSFESQSDTEVLIKAYHRWGTKAIDKFNGMFAVAIYDTSRNELILIRDRAGVKPLFWYYEEGIFLYASELKAILAHPLFKKQINHQAVGQYFRYGCVPSSSCIFTNTYKLDAGVILKLKLDDAKISQQRYWDISRYYGDSSTTSSEEELLNELEHLVLSSCKYRMIADVEVGSFLSGGYDSALVTAIMQMHSNKNIKTFTIGFSDKKFDEANYAKALSNYLDTDHSEYYCSYSDAVSLIPYLPEIWDEPLADPSTLPTFMVSKLAQEKVKVCVSADGGDELFAGYGSYISALRVSNILSQLPLSSQIGRSLGTLVSLFQEPPFSNSLVRRVYKILSAAEGGTALAVHEVISNIYSLGELSGILSARLNQEKYSLGSYDVNFASLDNLQILLLKGFSIGLIDQILVKSDRATMHNSLEGREPLLDYRIVEFAARLDSNYKIRNNTGKYLLKKLVHKYVPVNLVDRPKMGFNIPMADWFAQKEFVELVGDYLSRDALSSHDLLNTEKVLKIKIDFLNGSSVNLRQLWSIMVFQLWYTKWVK